MISPEARRNLLSNTWAEARTKPRLAFAKLARRARKAAGKKSLADPLCAATEWVVWALRHGRLTDPQIQALAAKKIDHADVYAQCAAVEESFTERSEPDTNEERVALIESLPFQNGQQFLHRLQNLADMVTPGKRADRGKKRGLVLEGYSRERIEGKLSWLFFTKMPEPGSEPETHGAKVFEAELSVHEPFRDELDKCVAAVGLARWEYVHSTERVVSIGRGPSPTRPKANANDWLIGKTFFRPLSACRIGSTVVGARTEAEELLWNLCNTWCIETVSTERGSTELENGLWISARRLDIMLTDDGTEVFIPRYYSHFDITYRPDFALLKKVMGRFSHIRLQQSRASRVKLAKLWREEMKRRGRTRREAWDEGRRRSGLSPEDMVQECGGRPRR